MAVLLTVQCEGLNDGGGGRGGENLTANGSCERTLPLCLMNLVNTV